MSNLLALDTSGNSCSVALLYQPAGQVGQVVARHEAAQRSHTQRLLPMIAEVLQEAGIKQSQLDAIAYGRGPGSFTGIRIAAGVAQGLAFGLDIPLIPVSTLAAMALQAQQAHPDCVYLCTLDARMNEVYAGTYGVDMQAPDLVTILAHEQVLPPSLVAIPEQPFVVCGSGMQVADFPVHIVGQARACMPDMEPMAQHMVALGVAQLAQDKGQLPEHGLPVYLRDEITWQKLPRYQ
ncbi:MAG: tRNA (adenosine(37)-N6)-threonylcarbamoyltransferase complex dimerization subunit type 1 TsaB [Gammaproteobacteria bacterium]|jgi:tRNA threonylcarbamoyladenosine biosynthesis protein TsaB|nr:tRNA (adenosine(37)-N6)-threonylcarbamoyltransferase complex dimerization subunit type 1 TsaB [Gammaproteobacteria bacterium]